MPRERLVPGEPIKASVLNQLPDAAEMLAKFSAASPMDAVSDRSGRLLTVHSEERFYAQLSGAGPAYSWAEVVPTSSGGFTTLSGGRTGTSNAYELNSKTGLSGDIVLLAHTSAGDYRFPLPRLGTTTCGSICVQVNGCNGQLSTVPIYNSTVTITQQSVASVTVTNGGSGYTSAPTVAFSGGTGSGATGTAVVSGGVVTAVNVTNGGIYTGAPTVSFSGGGGSGAAGTAVLSSPTTVGTCTTTGTVTSVGVSPTGSGYTSPPTVSFSGGGGSGATATANLNTTSLATVTLTAGGTGYTSVPTAAASGGHGSGASFTVTLTATSVSSVSVTAGGSGYTNGTYALGFSGGGGSGAAGTFTVSGGAVTGAVVTSGGTGYTSPPAVSFPGAGGSGATGKAVLAGTSVATIAFTSSLTHGSGYQSGDSPTIVFSGGGGSGAAATVTLGTFSVASVTVNNGGSGYTSAPTVTLTGGGGSGAAATATVANQCCIPIAAAGAYTITAAPPSGTNYQATSQSYTATCTKNTIGVGLPAATGYTCVTCQCEVTPPTVINAFPTTLHVSDGLGTATLTFQTTGTYANQWIGWATRTAANGYTNCIPPVTGGTNVSVPVFFVASCNINTWGLQLNTADCSNGGFPVGPAAAPTGTVPWPPAGGDWAIGGGTLGSLTVSSCSPLVASGTFAMGVINDWLQIYGNNNVTFTLSQ